MLELSVPFNLSEQLGKAPKRFLSALVVFSVVIVVNKNEDEILNSLWTVPFVRVWLDREG
jgi:hypothetical protein